MHGRFIPGFDLLDPPATRAALGHGYRVQAAIEIWRGDDLVQVPVASLFRSGGEWAVFLIPRPRRGWI